MISSKERKLERMASGLPDVLSPSMYNVAMMGTVLYGFIVNAVMVALLGDSLYGVNPIGFYIGYFISCIAGTFIAASDKPALSFLGYNLIVLPIGLLLCLTLPGYSSGLVMQAILLTAGIVLVMLALGGLYPQLFLSMGRALGVCLLVGCVLSLLSWFISGLSSFLVYGFAVLFSLYIGYDLARAQLYPRTLDNAIDSAIDIYLDIINLFLRILSILARLRGDD
ncbi:MAG: US12 family protein [Clostridia bacterium]|nr:US12 family protein [Clostridia bacterium]